MGQPSERPGRNSPGPAAEHAAQVAAAEDRNWTLLAAHLVLFRVGWVFKTESVIIPAFADAISGAGWLRGSIPLLTRLGHSIPPLLAARQLQNLAHKKWALAGTMLAMGLVAWGWAGTWWAVGGTTRAWLPAWFVAFYGLFAAAAGLHQLAFGTTQGKLIRATHRGRLFSVSIALGVVPAIGFAWWLMDDWLRLPDGGFTRLFFFAGVAFACSAAIVLALVEPADRYAEPAQSWAGYFRDAARVLERDRPFAMLCFVAMLFGTVPILFPHYQALGRDRLHLGGSYLAHWIVMQNVALGVASIVVGWLADRYGNRLAVRTLIFGTAFTPLVAVGLAQLDSATAGPWFWVVFTPLGLTPLVTKTLVNYALEFCPPVDHPRYLSTLNLCLALPFLFSPLVGWLIDMTSYEWVMGGGAGVIFLAGLLTFRLIEPRHDRAV